MVKIPHMHGMDTSGQYLAAVSATLDTITVTANTQPNVSVHPTLLRLLRLADIQPPPVGQVLTMAHVNGKLSATNLTLDEKVCVKQQLANMRMLSEGNGVNIFAQSRG
jgi:hypothetical protein